MKTILSACIVLIIIFTLSVLSHAQNDSLVDNMKTVAGNVVSVDSQNSQIVVKTYEIMTFSVPSNAKIVNADGMDIELSDVVKGSYVSIDYKDDKAGKHIVKGIGVDYNN
jgi:hypothetical protein